MQIVMLPEKDWEPPMAIRINHLSSRLFNGSISLSGILRHYLPQPDHI